MKQSTQRDLKSLLNSHRTERPTDFGDFVDIGIDVDLARENQTLEQELELARIELASLKLGQAPKIQFVDISDLFNDSLYKKHEAKPQPGDFARINIDLFNAVQKSTALEKELDRVQQVCGTTANTLRLVREGRDNAVSELTKVDAELVSLRKLQKTTVSNAESKISELIGECDFLKQELNEERASHRKTISRLNCDIQAVEDKLGCVLRDRDVVNNVSEARYKTNIELSNRNKELTTRLAQYKSKMIYFGIEL
jgi:hypothetical protein